MVERKRIYILAKTYPSISEKYAELVCTAGILEDGSWIRLYPLRFRQLEKDLRFSKFSWIEVDVERNMKDVRPESFRPSLNTLIVESKPKIVNWEERNRTIFKNTRVFTNLSELIAESKSPANTSLAIFKPSKIIRLEVRKDTHDWDPVKLAKLQAAAKQIDFFKTREEVIEEFRVVPKVPYNFYYHFEDNSGRKSTLMIHDWEIGMLYFNCLKQPGNDESVAIEKVKEKYHDEFSKKDIYFFLGTTLKHHRRSRNPFTIIGVYYPPFSTNDKQVSLFDDDGVYIR
jgi:hypothetical protein